ncbi:MAG: hypothetical protein ACE5GA_09345 [Candidatus Zixiibacteriota bacterium]
MSVNPLGVSAYDRIEQLNQRGGSEATRRANITGRQERAEGTGRAAEQVSPEHVTIAQKTEPQGSALGVKNASALTDILTAAEKAAIEELFSRYDFPDTEGAVYQPSGDTTQARQVGARVDYTV